MTHSPDRCSAADASASTARRPSPLALRVAIEGLINAKLHDALGRPDGSHRLIAHRTSGVTSPDIRRAARQLDEELSRILGTARTGRRQAGRRSTDAADAADAADAVGARPPRRATTGPRPPHDGESK